MSDNTMLGIEVARGHVLPEWIDINNHMNVAYYVLAFDQGVDSLWEKFGLSDTHIRTRAVRPSPSNRISPGNAR